MESGMDGDIIIGQYDINSSTSQHNMTIIFMDSDFDKAALYQQYDNGLSQHMTITNPENNMNKVTILEQSDTSNVTLHNMDAMQTEPDSNREGVCQQFDGSDSVSLHNMDLMKLEPELEETHVPQYETQFSRMKEEEMIPMTYVTVNSESKDDSWDKDEVTLENHGMYLEEDEGHRSKKWLVNLRRKDLLQKDTIYLHANIRLCANHFELSQFMNTDRNRLIWNAVPTLFDIPNKPPQVTPQRKLTMRCPLPQAKKLTVNIVKKEIEEVIIKKEIKEEMEIEEYEVDHADLEEMSVKVKTEHSLDSVSWKPFIGNSVWGDEEEPTQLFSLFSIEEHGASKSAIKEEKDVENGMILKQENSALKYPSVRTESNECLNSSLESAHHHQDNSSVGKIYLDQFHTSGNNLEHLCLKYGVEIDNSFYQNSRTSVMDTQISSLLNDSSCLQEKYEEKSKLQSRKKLYRCKHCKINLPHNSLKRHAAQEHGDLKPFCCVTCSSQFSSQTVLKRHAITHSKVRDFCCEVCGKTFGYRGTLKTHMFMHNWTVT